MYKTPTTDITNVGNILVLTQLSDGAAGKLIKGISDDPADGGISSGFDIL